MQSSQLSSSMRIHTIIIEPAVTRFLEVLAYLRLIVAQERANVLAPGEIGWHGVADAAAVRLPMREGTLLP